MNTSWVTKPEQQGSGQRGRRIFIGDVHGCFDELVDLLGVLNPRQGDDVVFLGDLIDRGPESRRVVELYFGLVSMGKAQGFAVDCLMGNHELKALKRFNRGEAVNDPLVGMIPRFAGFPLVKHWPGLVAVHGGFEAHEPWGAQAARGSVSVCYARYLKGSTGRTNGRVDPAEGDVFWAELWGSGETDVVYGHHVHSLTGMTVHENAGGRRCYGIDLGCCFGGLLAALVFHPEQPRDPELVTVPARRAYAERLGDATVP